MHFTRLTVAVGYLILALLLPIHAEAGGLKLRIEDGAGQGVVLSDTAGDGFLSFAGSIGNFEVTFTAGLSKPLIGDEHLAALHLTNLTVNAFSGGELTLYLEDTGYTVGVGKPLLTAVGSIDGGMLALPGATVTTQSWVNTSNLVPNLGADRTTPGALDPVSVTIPDGSIAIFDAPATFGSGHFSGESFATFVANGPYSLFSMTSIALSGPGIVSFNVDTLVAAPELGTLLLVGTGLLGATRLTRRRLSSSRA